MNFQSLSYQYGPWEGGPYRFSVLTWKNLYHASLENTSVLHSLSDNWDGKYRSQITTAAVTCFLRTSFDHLQNVFVVCSTQFESYQLNSELTLSTNASTHFWYTDLSCGCCSWIDEFQHYYRCIFVQYIIFQFPAQKVSGTRSDWTLGYWLSCLISSSTSDLHTVRESKSVRCVDSSVTNS